MIKACFPFGKKLFTIWAIWDLDKLRACLKIDNNINPPQIFKQALKTLYL